MWRPIQNTRPGIGWTISSADAETWDVEKKTSLYGTYHYDGFNKGNSKYTVQEEGIYRVNMQLRQDENGGGCMKVRVPPPHPLFLGWCVLCCRYSRQIHGPVVLQLQRQQNPAESLRGSACPDKQYMYILITIASNLHADARCHVCNIADARTTPHRTRYSWW